MEYHHQQQQQDNAANKLPPGWDCKYDVSSGKCYYFNYLTKAMSLEDPRIRLRQLQASERTSVESIPLQPMHGSPYHVYPTNNHPAMQAFQGPAVYNNNNNGSSFLTASPMLTTKFQQQHQQYQQMEMSPMLRHQNGAATGGGSPNSPRIMSQIAKQQMQLQQQQLQQQETSFITATETDAAVYKINAMFPTASESHIRLLLKKYYNREAVVISALQVEKHPLSTPGPYSTPPPPGRHSTVAMAAAHAFGMSAASSSPASVHMTPQLSGAAARFMEIGSATSRAGSPQPLARPQSGVSGQYAESPRIGESYRSSPRPHSSPKMKLRYLKSIFPKADETLLLDILANADNNVQHASEKLLSMGYEKRDTTAPKLTNRNREEQVMRDRKIAENTPPPQPKIRTNEEKIKIKQQLQSQYKDVPGRIITMALESVEYSENRACQILKIVMQDDNNKNDLKENSTAYHHAAVNKSSSRNSVVQQHSTFVQQDEYVSKATTEAAEISESMASTVQLVQSSTDVIDSSNISSLPATPISSSSLSSSSSSGLAADQLHQFIATLDSARKSKRNRFKTKCEQPKSSTTEKKIPIKSSAKQLTETVALVPASTPAAPSGTKINPAVATTGPVKEYTSVFGRLDVACGTKKELCHGPNEELLLVDYIAWNGANPDLHKGAAIAKKFGNVPGGSPKTGRVNLQHAKGPNAALYKGPNRDMAKGSVYSQMNASSMTNVKCN